MSDPALASVVDILNKKGLKIALGESCTGGLLADTFTNIEGASNFFNGSVVAYSDDAKAMALGIPKEELEDGIIKDHIAQAMAVQAAVLLRADIGIGITGNAGPTAMEGEVGQVFIAVQNRIGEGTIKEFKFQGSRLEIKTRAVVAAVELLKEFLDSQG